MSPVRWQMAEVPLGKGLDTKTDALLLEMGKLVQLQDITFTTGGALRRRNGYAQVGGALTNPKALFGEYGGELLAQANGQLQSYSQAQAAFQGRGACRSVAVSSQAISHSTASYAVTDCATISGITVYAWLSNVDGYIYARVVDEATGSVLLPDTAISSYAGAATVQCCYATGYLYVAYSKGNSISWRRLPVSTPATFDSEIVVISNASSGTNRFHLCNWGVTGLAILYRNAAGACLVTTMGNSGGGQTNSSSFGANYTNAAGAFRLASNAAGSFLWALYENAQGDLRVSVLNNLLVVGSTTGLSNLAGTYTCWRGGMVVDPGGWAWIVFDAQNTGDSSINRFTQWCAVATNGTFKFPVSPLTRSVSLASDLVLQDGLPHFWVKYSSSAQQTFTFSSASVNLSNSFYLLTNTNGDLVGKALDTGRAGEPNNLSWLPAHVSTAAGKYLAALPCNAPSDASAVNPQILISGVAAVRADFASERPRMAQLGQALHVFGGMVSAYDTVTPVEHGYPIFAEAPTLQSLSAFVTGLATWTATTLEAVGNFIKPTAGNGHYYVCTVAGTTGGAQPAWPTTSGGTVVDGTCTWQEAGSTSGSIAAGAHSYWVVYEWLNSKDELCQSSPSPSVPITLGALDGVVLTIPLLRITKKKNVRLAIYRTPSGGSTAQLVTTITNAPAAYSTSLDTVQYVDRTGDTSLFSGRPLYTQGEIPNTAPPACTVGCVRENRLYVNDGEDPQAVVTSKTWSKAYTANFSGYLPRLYTDPAGGPVTALAAMDDKTIIFQKTRICFVSGTGPDNTGAGGWSTINPQLISTGVGCIAPDSVCLTPDGLFFQSAKGFYLLGRDLSVRYIGAPVESFGAMVVSSARLAPSTTQVRVLGSAGNMLVWDYFYDQWGVFTVKGFDATSWGDLYTYVNTAGLVGQEAAGSTSDIDVGSHNPSLTFGWTHFGDLQGFERVRGFEVLVEGLSVGSIYAIANWNYDATNNNYSFPGVFALAGPPPISQFYFHMPIQKMESVQLQLVFNTTSPFTLTGLAFEVGLKGRAFRLPASQKTG